MSSLKDLIKAIKSDSNIIRFKELESVIDADPTLKKNFELLIHLQKIMVQKEAKKTQDFQLAKSDYDAQYETVRSHVLMDEYLDLLEVVNNDLQLIQSILTYEINADIE